VKDHPCLAVPESELRICQLGFGAARILGGPERRSSIRLLERALALGIRHFDTAPTYGNGQSEELVGDVLAGVAGVTIATKVGFGRPLPVRLGPGQRAYRRIVRPILSAVPAVKARLLRPSQPVARDFAEWRILGRDEVERSLDESARLLGRSPDVLLLHEPAQFRLDEELTGLMEALRSEGRFGAWGHGTAGPPIAFTGGQVWQSAAPAGPAPPAPALRLFHGVIRGARSTQDARARLRAALVARPEAGILVSASTAGQLDALVG
jgi:aryl-alcohol dehydrogenase-like predicted oxidoreductase